MHLNRLPSIVRARRRRSVGPGEGRERGQAIIIAAIAMAAVIAIAAYAINTAEWWDHSHHLQEQADAAALAAASNYNAALCQSSPSTVNTDIANTIAQYDGGSSTTQGNGFTGTATSTYNSQIYPTTQATGHTLTALINSNYFVNPQNWSGSPLTGNPCTDGVIDVKLTETNLGSLLPIISPQYINAESEVGFYEVSTDRDVEPFIFQDDVPQAMWVEQIEEVNEGNNTYDPVLATQMLSNNNGTFSAQLSSFAAENHSGSSTAAFPLGYRIVASAFPPPSGSTTAPSCPPIYGTRTNITNDTDYEPNGVVCYDIGPSNPSSTNDVDTGVGFTNVWSSENSYNAANGDPTTPGQPYYTANNQQGASPAAPQAEGAWIVPCAGTGSCTATNASQSCGTSPSTNSNFSSASASTTVVLCADVAFTSSSGTPITCSQASLTATEIPTIESATSAPQVAMNCPTTGGLTGATPWYSSGITIAANSGPTSFALSWVLKTGAVPTEDNSSGNNVVTTPSNPTSQISETAKSGTWTTGSGENGTGCTPTAPCACTTGNKCTCSNSNPCQCTAGFPCICSGSFSCNCTNYVCTCNSANNAQCSGSFDGYTAESNCAVGDVTTSYSSSNSPCGEIVQRYWAGAYNQDSGSVSRSGPLTNLAITNCTTGNAIQSIQVSNPSNVNACLSVTTVADFSTDTISASSIGNPISLNAGDDDVSGEWDCATPLYNSGSNNYNPDYESGNSYPRSDTFNQDIQWWIEDGCNTYGITPSGGSWSSTTTSWPPLTANATPKYAPGDPPPWSGQTTGGTAEVPIATSTYDPMSTLASLDAPPAAGYTTTDTPSCPTTTTFDTPATGCVMGVDDPDITTNLMAGLNERIYRETCTPVDNSGGLYMNCTPPSGGVKCNNLWDTANNVNDITSLSPADPRLVSVPLTYYGELYANASVDPPVSPAPIAGFAEFYITGWWGDPCSSIGGDWLSGDTYKGYQVAEDDAPPTDPDEGQNGSIDDDQGAEGTTYSYTSGQCLSTSTPPTPGYNPNGPSLSGQTLCSDQGVLLGHFVTYVAAPGLGTASSTQCTASTLGICTAVLEK